MQELPKKLVLKGDELDDKVLLREDLNNLREGACWMSIVKVNTIKHFGNQPFFQKMDVAWVLHGSGIYTQLKITWSSSKSRASATQTQLCRRGRGYSGIWE
jgi:hypothetical protein